MEYEMPRNMGNMDYEKKLEISNNELENANREVKLNGPLVCFATSYYYFSFNLISGVI